MNYTETKARKDKQAAHSREESKKRHAIITSIKDKEDQLRCEEEKVQALKQAIDIIQHEEDELVTNMIKTPKTSAAHSSSHMAKKPSFYEHPNYSNAFRRNQPSAILQTSVNAQPNSHLVLPDLSRTMSQEQVQ